MDFNKTAAVVVVIVVSILGGGYYLVNNFIIGLSRPQAVENIAALSLEASPSSVPVGGQLTVNVVLNTGTEAVTATDINIVFPQTNLELVSIVPGSFLPVILSPATIGAGMARIVVVKDISSKPPWVTGIGTVAVLTFKALQSGAHRIDISTASKVAASGKPGDVLGSRMPVTVVVQ